MYNNLCFGDYLIALESPELLYLLCHVVSYNRRPFTNLPVTHKTVTHFTITAFKLTFERLEYIYCLFNCYKVLLIDFCFSFIEIICSY